MAIRTTGVTPVQAGVPIVVVKICLFCYIQCLAVRKFQRVLVGKFFARVQCCSTRSSVSTFYLLVIYSMSDRESYHAIMLKLEGSLTRRMLALSLRGATSYFCPYTVHQISQHSASNQPLIQYSSKRAFLLEDTHYLRNYIKAPHGQGKLLKRPSAPFRDCKMLGPLRVNTSRCWSDE